MKDLVYEKDYTDTAEPNPIYSAIYEQVTSGGLLKSLEEKLGRIPKLIVPEGKRNFDYLLEHCDRFAQRHYGKIYAVVSYQYWSAFINLTLPCVEFSDPEDFALMKDISERSKSMNVVLDDDGSYHIIIFIKYFRDLLTDEELKKLEYETILENPRLVELLHAADASPEQQALARHMTATLDRFDAETSIDRTTAFRAALDQLLSEDGSATLERLDQVLSDLLADTLNGEFSKKS